MSGEPMATYDPVTKFFHWSIAALFVAIVPLGLWAASIGPGSPDPVAAQFREDLLWWHKSFGLAVLFLTIPRIVWTLRTQRPPVLPDAHPMIRLFAKAVHAFLYVLMIGLPLTGILLSQAASYSVSFFGLFDLPDLVRPSPDVPVLKRPEVFLGIVLHKVVFAYALYAAFAFHIAGLLKHHFLERDPSTWARMRISRSGR